MRTLEEITDRIKEARDRYELCKLSQVADQMEILRTLSICYHELDEYRIDAYNLYMDYYNKKDGSNPIKDKYASTKVPELYLLRRTMESTNLLIKAVISTLSTAKQINS